ncbi:MAG TPA: phosphoglucosamine mutase, partial [bacterium]|nr:phosphoglucosamine mutase [bacterium]
MAKPVMISVSGIRGIVGEGLSPELIVNLASAAGTFYGPGRVFVGRDPRVTGDMVKHAVFAGLIAVGCDPVDLGICATPSVEIAVRRSDAVGGIIITASHNPVEWNALKLLGGGGLFLNAGEGLAVKRIAEEKTFAYKPWDQLGRAGRFDHATRDHIAHILSLSFLDGEALRKRRFRVAFDAVNGAGGVIVPKMLEALGCEIFPLNTEPTGLFAH